MYRVFRYTEQPDYWPATATVYINNGSSVREYVTDENGIPTPVSGSGGGGSSSIAWGDITGDLINQGDLTTYMEDTYQHYDPDLDIIASLTGTGFLKRTGPSAWVLDSNSYLTTAVTSISAGTGMSFTTVTSVGAVAIDSTKVPYLSGGFSTGLLKWNGSTWVFDSTTYLSANQTITLSGDTTGSGTTSITTTIPARTVTFSKFQDINTSRLLGRTTAGSGSMEELDINQVTSLLGLASFAFKTYPTDATGYLYNNGSGTLSWASISGSSSDSIIYAIALG